MLHKILLIALALCTGSAWAGIDINQADVADLDGIRGVGPSMSRKILLERDLGKFKNWADLIARVPGVKDKTAAKFSDQGFTIDGQSFVKTPATPP